MEKITNFHSKILLNWTYETHNMGLSATKIVSEFDREIPQSQTADKPMALRERATQPSQDTRKTSLLKQPSLSSPSR